MRAICSPLMGSRAQIKPVSGLSECSPKYYGLDRLGYGDYSDASANNKDGVALRTAVGPHEYCEYLNRSLLNILFGKGGENN